MNQATVQRFLAGSTKTITKSVRKMLEYAEIDIDKCISAPFGNASENPHIRQALERVWDGSDDSAKMLARLIVAVRPSSNLAAHQLHPDEEPHEHDQQN